MSRVISIETSGKTRNQLLKSIALAIRELSSQQDVNNGTRDLIAYIGYALLAISKTIDDTVAPWEKRGYWIKSDRFRQDWLWTENWGKSLHTLLIKEDWEAIAKRVGEIAEKINGIHIPKRHQLGTPWVGSWSKLIQEQK